MYSGMFDGLYRAIFALMVILFVAGIGIGSCATSCSMPYRVKIERVTP